MKSYKVGEKYKYDIIDRYNSSQDEIAISIEQSIDTIYISNGDAFKPISKEDVHYLDVSQHRFKIKLNKKIKKHSYSLILNHSSSSSGSGCCGYGLDLI